MKGFVQVLAALGGLALVSDAQQTTTYSNCVTEMGSTRVASVPTSSDASTQTITTTVTSTQTPTKTITPTNTKTTTVTAVKTATSTGPKTTDTITITSLKTATDTSTAPTYTVTILTEASQTSFTTSGTTTVPTPSGFSNAGATVPKPTSKREVGGSLLALAVRHGKRKGRAIGEAAPKSFPQRVVCHNIVQIQFIDVKTTTASNTVTKTASTVTILTASTTTSTQTITAVNPPATSTSTQTTTTTQTVVTTPTTTFTTTSTTTFTVVKPAATTYAACGVNNLKGGFQMQGIQLVYPSDDSITGTTTDNTAYDCCVSCINNPKCQASQFYDQYGCTNFISTADTCKDGDDSFGVHLNSSLAMKQGYIISNGNCAFYNYFK